MKKVFEYPDISVVRLQTESILDLTLDTELGNGSGDYGAIPED